MISMIPFLMVARPVLPYADRISLGLSLMVVGMGVVFVALMVIGSILAVLGKVLRHPVEEEQAASTASAPASHGTFSPVAEGPQTSMAAGLDDTRLVAVLTAAATTVVGRRLRIRRIVSAGPAGNAWASMGRSSIQTSHNLRGSRR